jgi:hypothetical protein
MNNTRAIVAVVLTAATLVVGLTSAAATMTPSAFAGGKKGNENDNGNTVTILKCKNKGSSSGWDTTTNQECENTICTHPGAGATCESESEGTVIIGNETNAALCPNGGFFNPSAGKCVGAGAGGT